MQQIKILIIDDEEDFCLLMKMYFSRINCNVQISYTLKTGLEMIDQYKPDVLFLDNNLPDGHGWMYVNDIMKKWSNIQIHLISAFKPGTDHITRPANLRVWEKPISLEDLQDVFRKTVTL